jgi:geranylgeranyl diphosphate synthase type II
MNQAASRTTTATAQLLHAIEQGVQTLPLERMQPHTLYGPMRYVLDLKAKRMRPLLVLMAYQSYAEGPPTRCLNTALAVELFHNFTLMHDDIMDNAPTRRGQPTVHEKWNANTAILSGDAMFALSMKLVAEDFPALAADQLSTFAKVALEVCEGQMLDMDLAQQPHATVDQYLEMIRMKTAALLGGSLHLGAVAAGAPADDVKLLHRFGELAGIAFQLQDDYMDVYAEEAKFGKQPGGDIIENKKTYLWLRARDKATATQRAELVRWLGITDRNAEKVQAVRGLFNELNIPADTQALIRSYFDQAHATIQPLTQRPGIQALLAFMDELGRRDQ